VAVPLNGPATVTDNIFDSPGHTSTGVYLFGGAAGSTISGNTFSDDGVDAERRFGISGGGSVTISGNTFTNLSDPIFLGVAGDPTISENVFTGTHVASGGSGGRAIAVLSSARPTIVANRFHSPDSGSDPIAVSVEGGSAGATLRRNRILDHQGVLDFDGGPVTLDGDLIAGSPGWGLRLGDGAPAGSADVTVTHVTFADNAADILNVGALLTLDSSIVEDEVDATAGADCAIAFSRGPTTTGTACQTFQTDAAPGFASTDLADPAAFHLSPGSPLVDMGSTEPPPSLLDLDGNDRVLDGDCDGAARRDIGADELVRDCTPAQPAQPAEPAGPTGQRAAALKKCKKLKNKKKRKKCRKKAQRLPL
jgi:hypothetical protein